jgi:hypothetical protein
MAAKLTPILLALSITLIGGTSDAYSSQGNGRDPTIREEFSGTKKMPDGIALQALLSIWTGFPDTLSDPGILPAHIHMVYGIDKESAAHLVGYLLTMAKDLEAELSSSNHMIMCPTDVNERNISSLAYIADMADDMSELVHEKYLMIAMTHLSEQEKDTLHQILDDTKASTSYVKDDHSQTFQESPIEEIRARFENYCSQQGGAS